MVLARKLKDGDLKIPMLGVGGGPGQLSWLVQGYRMEEPQKPLISLGPASSFRGLDGEVNEPLNTSWASPCSHPAATHSASPAPEQSQVRQKAVRLEAVVVEARNQACFWGNRVPFLTVLSCIPSLATAVRWLPQLSSAVIALRLRAGVMHHPGFGGWGDSQYGAATLWIVAGGGHFPHTGRAEAQVPCLSGM